MHKTQNSWTKELIKAHILANFKGKSVAQSNPYACTYRSPQGKKCAAGLFIPDELYDQTMENTSIAMLMLSRIGLRNIFPLSGMGMIGLQKTHDLSDPVHTLQDILHFIDAHVED